MGSELLSNRANVVEIGIFRHENARGMGLAFLGVMNGKLKNTSKALFSMICAATLIAGCTVDATTGGEAGEVTDAIDSTPARSEVAQRTQENVISYPNTYDVLVEAGGRSHDDTSSTIWVRIYSDDLGQWSSYKSFSGGFDRNQNRAVRFEMSPLFTDVTRVEVWEGANDGMGATVTLHHVNSERISYFNPEFRWVKNQGFVFHRSHTADSSTQFDEAACILGCVVGCTVLDGGPCWQICASGCAWLVLTPI